MHGDFATVPFLQKDLPKELQRGDETKVRSPQAGADGAAVVFHQVLISMEQIFTGRPLDRGVFTNQSTRQSVTYTAAVSEPSQEELYWIYKSKGLQAAKDAVTAAKSVKETVFDESGSLPSRKNWAIATGQRSLWIYSAWSPSRSQNLPLRNLPRRMRSWMRAQTTKRGACFKMSCGWIRTTSLRKTPLVS
jgi:hypothetical protein